MGDLHVTVNFYRTDCRLSDSESLFFTKQKNSFREVSAMSVPLSNNTHVQIMCYHRKNEERDIRQFCVISN